MPTNPLIFNPSPAQADQVIHDLGSPHLTLRDVAELHNTTIQSLTLWIAMPDTSSRLSNINNAIVTRSRHAACNYLARATETVITSLDAYIDEEKHIPVRPNSIEDREQRRRSRQTACHAVSLLLRIAKFSPAPPRPSDPTRKRRYSTAHSNRINEVLTSLGAPRSISAEEESDRFAADSPSASPAPLRDTSPSSPRQHTNGDHYNRITDLVADLDPKSPSRREGLGWVPSSPDQQSSDDPAHNSPTNAPSNPLPAAGRAGEGLVTSAVESQAPSLINHTSRHNKLSLPPPKRGDPDWEPWMANGELPYSVEKKLRQQSDSTTPNTAATLQPRAGAPQPFTPLTISAQNSNGKTHSCSTPCARGCPTPHPP